MLRVGMWCAALVATTVATFIILMPASMVPNSHFSNQDKIEHITATAILGCLWMLAVRRPLSVIVGGICYGISTELLQKWMALGRTCDPMDALADTTGTVIGVIIVLAWAHHRRRRNHASLEDSAA